MLFIPKKGDKIQEYKMTLSMNIQTHYLKITVDFETLSVADNYTSATVDFLHTLKMQFCKNQC